MDTKKRAYINELADKIRLACELNPPIDLETAIKILGGELEYSDSLDFEAQIEKINDEFKITLKKDSHVHRSRFSIAHELGHLFLHMGYIIDEKKWNSTKDYTDSVYYRYGYSTEEYEANEFAAAFLMPKAVFIDITENNYSGGKYNINDIAEYFKVSTEAAINRGRWIGLFSWNNK